MNKNVDQGSAVECTAAHPRLTKSPKEEEKLFFMASLNIERVCYQQGYVYLNEMRLFLPAFESQLISSIFLLS
jgi:hypothetical protein